MSLQKALPWIQKHCRRAATGKLEGLTVEINSGYCRQISSEQRTRRKVYGAIKYPLLCQDTPDELLARLTHCPGVKHLYFSTDKVPPQYSQHDQEARRSTELSYIKEKLRNNNIQLPCIWATQTEVKGKLKAAQEAGELRALAALAQRRDARSASARMLINWGLDRERPKRILSHLETGRVFQTTFTNLVGATRFKAIKEGELRHTCCPKCGGIDSWMHCVQCYRIEISPVTNEQTRLSAVKKLVQLIATDSPASYQAGALRDVAELSNEEMSR